MNGQGPHRRWGPCRLLIQLAAGARPIAQSESTRTMVNDPGDDSTPGDASVFFPAILVSLARSPVQLHVAVGFSVSTLNDSTPFAASCRSLIPVRVIVAPFTYTTRFALATSVVSVALVRAKVIVPLVLAMSVGTPWKAAFTCYVPASGVLGGGAEHGS